MSDRPKHVYEVYIRTTPQRLWDAVTKPEFTRQYFYETAVVSDWKVGSPFALIDEDDGSHAIDGKVLEVDAPRKLVHTFSAAHSEIQKHDRPSRVTWRIEPMGDACKLTLVHDDFDEETETYTSVATGWNPVLSGLKTLLETGKPLIITRPA